MNQSLQETEAFFKSRKRYRIMQVLARQGWKK
jgi:hypothetical protein